jgi:hypothetical protein
MNIHAFNTATADAGCILEAGLGFPNVEHDFIA